ncbi:MAG TPA: hypothetical protein PL070_10085 [Flavobacteriales bacterium]|nr:hypothetical protein [Flavobacteriales bacterium]
MRTTASTLTATAAALLFTACGGGTSPTTTPTPAITSELAYLRDFAPQRAAEALGSEPFNTRLKALLGSRRPDFIRALSGLGPGIEADSLSVTLDGCKAHDCAATNGRVFVDLVQDNILVGYRVDNRIGVYTEKPFPSGTYPAAFMEWAGKDPIAEGVRTGGTPEAESAGAFVWIPWEKVSENVRTRLKSTRWGRGGSEYDEIVAAVGGICEVHVAEHDLNGDGKPGLVIAKHGCMDYCGSAGCSIVAYDGGRKLGVNDEWELVKPGNKGLVTSAKVLIPLR